MYFIGAKRPHSEKTTYSHYRFLAFSNKRLLLLPYRSTPSPGTIGFITGSLFCFGCQEIVVNIPPSRWPNVTMIALRMRVVVGPKMDIGLYQSM
jgi:hypothetical protein